MEIFRLIFGLSIIGIGFILKKYPNLISGYSTMSEEKRKNVDIESVSTVMKKGMIIIGTVMIIGANICSWLGLPTLADIFLIGPLLIGVLILQILVQKYDKNKQSKLKQRAIIVFLSILNLIIILGIYGSTRQSEVIFSGNDIEFTGSYSVTIQSSELKNTELLDSIPDIIARTNGFALGNFMKGHFKLKEIGRCRLFLKLPNPPFLFIELNNGRKILFNSTDSEYTKSVYEEISKKID